MSMKIHSSHSFAANQTMDAQNAANNVLVSSLISLVRTLTIRNRLSIRITTETMFSIELYLED